MSLDKGNCKYCIHVLSGITIKHNILECQYRQGMYCSVCMAYGHTPDDCPNKIAWAIRRGEDASHLENNILRVEGTEEGVKDMLKSYGIKSGTRILENRKILRNLANCLKPPKLVHFVTPQ